MYYNLRKKELDLNIWKVELERLIEENRLAIIMEADEKVAEFLETAVIREVTSDFGWNVESGKTTIVLSDGIDTVTYTDKLTSDYWTNLECSFLDKHRNPTEFEFLLDLMKKVNLKKIRMHCYYAEEYPLEFKAVLKHSGEFLKDLEWITDHNAPVIGFHFHNKAFNVVLKENKAEAVKNAVLKEFWDVVNGDYVFEGVSVGWLSKNLDINVSTVLGVTDYIPELVPNPNEIELFEEQVKQLVEKHFDEERFVKRKIRELGYNGILGKCNFSEIETNNCYIYRTK